MRATTKIVAFILTASLAGATVAAPGGNGKGKGGNDGGGGGDPPTADFVPRIAYFSEGRKAKDLRLSNRAGDQACLVMQSANGSPTLRGFSFDAANRKLAYSVGESGIYLTSWGAQGPCFVESAANITHESFRIRGFGEGVHPEVMDFSPLGKKLVWTEPNQAYTGPGSEHRILLYDLETKAVSELPLIEWQISGIRFSPDFETSRELFFVGGPLDLSQGAYASLFAVNIDDVVSAATDSDPASDPDTIPDKIYDGINVSFDLFIGVTNPDGQGAAKVTFTDNNTKQIYQVPIGGGSIVTFAGGEGTYSCDNTEIIHAFESSRSRRETRVTQADGSSSERWSRDELRWLDWLCP